MATTQARKRTRPSDGAVPSRKDRMSDEEFRATGRTPFLRPSHVVEGETLKLTGFNNDKGDQVICEVENKDGLQFSMGIRKGSPDHRVLFHELGRSPEEWIGSIVVTLAPSTRGGDGFVNVKSATPDEPPF